jgi:hypothetical protein
VLASAGLVTPKPYSAVWNRVCTWDGEAWLVYTKPRAAMHCWVSSVLASASVVCWTSATSA